MRALFSLFSLLSLACTAQELVLRHLDEEHGLPSNCVLDLFIDHDDLLWIGTNNGLYRYDGFHFERIGVGTPMDEKNVVSMYEDTVRGCMLFSTYGSELFMLRQGEVRRIPTDDVVMRDHGGRFTDFRPMKDGRIRAARDLGRGTYIIDPDHGSVVLDSSSCDRKYRACITEENGRPLGWLSAGFRRNIPVWEDSIAFRNVHEVLVAGPMDEHTASSPCPIADRLPGGGFYVFHNQYLWLFDENGERRDLILNGNILGVTMDASERLWVRVYGFGVKCFDRQLRLLPLGSRDLERTNVTDCVRSLQGGLWFSTYDRGLFYCASPDVRSFSARDHFGVPALSCIAPASDSAVYCGTFNGRLLKAGANGSWELLAGADGSGTASEIKGLTFLEDSILLPGCMQREWRMHESKLVRHDDRNPRWRNIYHAEALGKGRWLMAAIAGLQIADMRWPDSTIDLHVGDRCFALLERPRSGQYWVATERGLYLTDTRTAWPVDPSDPLLNCRIHDLAQAGDSLWLGTQHGLVVLSRSGSRSYPLPLQKSTQARSLHVQGGRWLWVGSLDGLFRVDLAQPSSPILRYGEPQGFPSNSFYDVLSTGDLVWAICGYDLCCFDPDRFRAPDPGTRLSVLDLSATGPDGARIPGPEFGNEVDHVRLRLQAVNYARMEQDAFRYRLVGNSQWSLSGSPVLDLVGLEPGAYTAEVQAADANGDWGNSVLVAWRIRFAFWQRGWFKVLAGCAGTSALLFFLWYYRNRKQRELLLAAEVQRYHHKALLAQMEPHFLYNALNSIQGFVAQNDIEASSRYLAKFAKLMRGLLNAAHDEQVTLEEEMAILSNYCALEALRTDPPFTYEVSAGADLSPATVRMPSFLVQPYVENAIRHGIRNAAPGQRGELLVRFERKGSARLLCSVEDNGIGREAAGRIVEAGEGWRSMGTRINDQRVPLLSKLAGNTGIVITTEDLRNAQGAAAGTRVTIELPLITGSAAARAASSTHKQGT